MSWVYHNIPKIAHFYWGKNTSMSFLQFLTVKTFKKLNPDWYVKLWVPKYPNLVTQTWESGEQKIINLNKDFFDEATKYCDTIQEVDFNEIGFTNNTSEIHKSDFIRIYLLSKEGGLWSDMDIIYIKPMHELQLPENINLGVVYQVHEKVDYYLIGFMLSSKNNDYFNTLLNSSLLFYNKKDYQSIGASLVNKIFPNIESIRKLQSINVCNLDMDIVYPYDYFNLKKLITFNNENLITNKTIGIHWFNGDPMVKELVEKIDPYNIKSETMLDYLLKPHQL